MENYSVYEDIASRTGGDIYIGVVGPVRTGKSTFIKRFMEKLVLPFAPASTKKVMRDELPQPAAGKTVMTTEPKFVPSKAAPIKLRDGASCAVRLVDCVGYSVEGASGYEEDGAPRLVKTPWTDTPLPFEEAASIGTQKVICDHSTIGILVTTDGSVTELAREAYVPAEERAAAELKSLGKPFVILLNCKDPASAQPLRAEIEEKYGAPVVAASVEKMTESELLQLLQTVLFEFPLAEISVRLPGWVQSFSEDEEMIACLMEKLKAATPSLTKMKDCLRLESLFEIGEPFENPNAVQMDLGRGKVEVFFQAAEGQFYQMLSKTCGEKIDDDFALMQYVISLAASKRAFDCIKDAFTKAQTDGYGMVAPDFSALEMARPKLIKKGAGYGVQFKAAAPSYHIVKVDVGASVCPIVGDQKQGQEFISATLEKYDAGSGEVWDTNIFGKTLRELIETGLCEKGVNMPVEVRGKMRRTITRIVNENRGGVICILL